MPDFWSMISCMTKSETELRRLLRPVYFDLPDLRLLLAVAECGSLSEAAARLPLALSAASARLRGLESRLGVQLLQRKAHGMALTEAGLLWVQHARRTLQAASEAQEAATRQRTPARQHLRVQANTTASHSQLPAQLGAFLQRHPELDLTLEEGSSRDVWRAVAAGQTDLGVIDGDYHPEGLLILPYRQYRLVVVTAAGHPLAQKLSCRFSEALQQPLVGLPEERALQGFIEKMARHVAVQPVYRARAPGFYALVQLVVAQLGIGFLPVDVALAYRESHPIAVVELEDGWATRQLQLCLPEQLLSDSLLMQLARWLTD